MSLKRVGTLSILITKPFVQARLKKLLVYSYATESLKHCNLVGLAMKIILRSSTHDNIRYNKQKTCNKLAVLTAQDGKNTTCFYLIQRRIQYHKNLCSSLQSDHHGFESLVKSRSMWQNVLYFCFK